MALRMPTAKQEIISICMANDIVRIRQRVRIWALTFDDKGPGIADLDLALTEGYTTGGGLGMGLSGARRLVTDFELRSKLGEGTQVIVTKWR
jgi:serine/threonine-protein kinase RsbT